MRNISFSSEYSDGSVIMLGEFLPAINLEGVRWVAHELEGKDCIRSAGFVIMYEVSLIVLRQLLTASLRKVGGEPAEPPTEEQEKLWKYAPWAPLFSEPGSQSLI